MQILNGFISKWLPQQIPIRKSNLAEYTKLLFISILLIAITFPEYSFSFGRGIDPPLAWLFNFLFNGNLNLGRDIVFPHGPLAFITYPIYYNALVGIAVKTMLQIVFLYNLFKVVEGFDGSKWLLFFGAGFFLLKIYSVSLLILSTVLIGYLNFIHSKKLHYKLVAIVIACLAFYVKANLAIIAGVISLSFLILEYFVFKEWRKTLTTVLLGSFFLVIIWLIMYQSFGGFGHYIVGMIHLSQDNSAAAALYPRNNWVLLSIFLIIMVSTPFIQKDKKAVYFAALFLPGFFGAWKHGIAREDVYHMAGFLYFSISSLIIFILYTRENLYRNIVLAIIALSCLYLNTENSISYKPLFREISGIVNFKNTITGFKSIVNKSIEVANKDMEVRKLPPSLIDTLGKETIDIYPWDYSIIAVNNLNLAPRVVIQSYAAYTSWLDQQNASHFSSKKAPQYLLWHSEENAPTLADLKSIDGRYLLNDEPQTLIEFFKNYKLYTAIDWALIFRKRDIGLTTNTQILDQETVTWNEWIKIPANHNNILRAKIKIKGNVLRKLKAFFYKDEAFYVYYKLSNGSILSKKIVPRNAEDGLWVNPFVQYPGIDKMESEVVEIMLKCSNPNLMNPEILIEWESISFEGYDNSKQIVYNFFGKPERSKNYDTLLYQADNSFETKNSFWKYTPECLTNKNSYSGLKSYLLVPGKFSPIFQVSLDTLPEGLLQLKANAFAFTEIFDKAVFILSLENKNGTFLWQGLDTYYQIIDKNAWNYIENNVQYFNHPNEPVLLKVYFWNTGGSNLYLDDLKIEILTIRS